MMVNSDFMLYVSYDSPVAIAMPWSYLYLNVVMS